MHIWATVKATGEIYTNNMNSGGFSMPKMRLQQDLVLDPAVGNPLAGGKVACSHPQDTCSQFGRRFLALWALLLVQF